MNGYPCVVIPIHTTHYMMLQRNLIYTAITRGKRLVVMVGAKRAVGIAVGRTEAGEDYNAEGGAGRGGCGYQPPWMKAKEEHPDLDTATPL